MRIPRAYKDNTKEAVYENSIDCLIYGYGKDVLNTCGLDEKAVNEIWNKAKDTLARM